MNEQQVLSSTRLDLLVFELAARCKEKDASIHMQDCLAAAKQAQTDGEDARRYRWLRDQDWTKETLCVRPSKSLPLGTDVPTHERLDAIIDAGRGA